MAPVEDRARDSVELLLRSSDRPTLDANLGKLRLISMGAIGFLERGSEEFGADISPEADLGFDNLSNVARRRNG
ncbi:MAG: hypothetical protein OXI87_08200 [Albidovulum sp.]|nr:hypothetical protein [Albidovulum sp.]MDE0530117.1 hypothetical protein [Albidovulum sp.]